MRVFVPKRHLTGAHKNHRVAMRYKISVVGSAGCGKTTLVHSIAYNRPPRDADEAVDIHSMRLRAGGEIVSIRIWDTMKGEYMGNVSSIAHKSACICLVVFDFISRHSFIAASQYVQEVLGLEPNLSIIFVATKCDLADISHRIAVTHEEARAFASLYDSPIFFVCGLTGVGINQILNEMSRIISTKMVDTAPKSVLSLEDLEVTPSGSKCYC